MMRSTDRPDAERGLSGKSIAVLHALQKRQGARAYARAAGLSDWLRRETQLTRIELRQAFKELRDRELVEASSWPAGDPDGKVSTWMPPVTAPAWAERWTALLSTSGLGPEEIATLQNTGKAFSGWSDQDITALLSGIKRLTADRSAGARDPGESVFQTSARQLLGSSKLFRAVIAPEHLATRELRAADSGMPPYVLVAGPSNPSVVTLVENPFAFEAAVAAGFPGAAWIATFGYGLSLTGDQHGSRLADQLDNHDRLIPLVRDGCPPRLSELLAHRQLYFWGDLDPAGWSIFSRLRSRLPHLRLSPLYMSMRELFEGGLNHPLDVSTGKAGQIAMKLSSGAPEWWPTDRGLDQEAVVLHIHMPLTD